jgi:hypothetical protein
VSERCESCIEGGARGTCGGKGLPVLNQPAIRRPASVRERCIVSRAVSEALVSERYQSLRRRRPSHLRWQGTV